MRWEILHESRGRLRVHRCGGPMTVREADLLDAWLSEREIVRSVRVYERTGDAVICYGGERGEILDALARFRCEDREPPSHSGREIARVYRESLVMAVGFRAMRKLFLPAPLQLAWTAWKSLGRLARGLRHLLRGELRVEVLDALSIGASWLRADAATADSVIFLLELGELLEEWTHRKSVDDLARSMALNIDQVWLVREDGELLVPMADIRPGDRIRVRAGGLIPADGRVIEGECLVNQASLTGESLPVEKRAGDSVYAGTAVEEGSCVLEAKSESGQSRYDRIVSLMEQSLPSETETRAARLADRLVPVCLGGVAVTYALTRNVSRAVSLLMVDFSCALKLAMPLSFLSAMSEAGRRHITVKGGKYLEAAARADTVVFDKTGTLTRACPTVAEVVPFGGRDWREVLRLAACLEEHFPHSIANAVVRRARELGLDHRRLHADLEYLVAHGIASTVEGQRTVVGSWHFVFEDEGCTVPPEEQEKFDALSARYSHLYLAIGGELAAVIGISDPLREEAPAVLRELRELGLSRLVMMTGDSAAAAAAIAREAGVDAWLAEVLPEDKAAFVRQEREAGRTVLMVGDGINDAPALSAAGAGIAISDGAAIAREAADITIGADDLRELVTLRKLSTALMRRVEQNYRFVMGFNGALMALGALGVLGPAPAALLHNLSTLAVSLRSMTPLLRQEE